MSTSSTSLKPIALFFSLTIVLSSIFYFLIIYSGSLGSGRGLYVTGLMWCPGISAILSLKLLGRKLSDLGWSWGKTKYQLQSYLIPIFYAFVTYLIVWVFGFGGFYDQEFVDSLTQSFGLGEIGSGATIVLYVLLLGIFGTIKSAASALGEEIGWRGFLAPEMYKRFGYTKTSLITGAIWGVWHLPILLFADYNSGTPSWYAMSCFLATIISINFIFTWYRMKSGSLWTGVILHASHNLFIQNIFTPLTTNTGTTAYYIDEFGIVLPLVGVAFAIYFWTRRKELALISNKVL